MENIKNSAIDFAKSMKLGGKEITYKRLLTAITKKEFIVKSYDEASTALITLGLYEEAKDSDSVSAVDKSGIPHIFMDNNIPREFRHFTLAHEIGHIMLKHRKTPSLKRQQEREADLFAHYLLSNSNRKNFKLTANIVSILLCLSMLVTAVIIAPSSNEPAKAVSAYNQNTTEEKLNNNTTCYFTEYGEVYHIYKDCYYLKNSKAIYTTTIGQCQHNRMCSACSRRLNNE